MHLQRWHKLALAAFLLGCVWIATYTRTPLTESQLHERGLWQTPKLAVDAFIVQHTPATAQWDVLLIQRTREPYKDHWALPGGFVGWMEDPVDAVVREVAEETNLAIDPNTPPVFVLFRGSPTRDPRTHTVRCVVVERGSCASIMCLHPHLCSHTTPSQCRICSQSHLRITATATTRRRCRCSALVEFSRRGQQRSHCV